MPKKEDIRAPAPDRDIREVPIEKIDPFPDHPYKVLDDEDMDQLTESIKAKGLITPLLVRKMPHDRYELISGHRRLHACVKLGMDKVICEVREMSKDEAIITMVESNFQRDRLLPSEKAFAYKMRLDAMKMQLSRMRENQKKGRDFGGKPVEPQVEAASEHLANSYGLTRREIESIGSSESRKKENRVGAPVGHLPEGMKSRDVVAADMGESKSQIQRYIRLTELIPELLELVDDGRMGMRTAVELSYLEHRQKDVYECIESDEVIPTHAQAIRMRRMFEGGELTPRDIYAIMAAYKPNQIERISLREDRFGKLIPKSLDKREREDYIEDALKYYARYLERKSRGQER